MNELSPLALPDRPALTVEMRLRRAEWQIERAQKVAVIALADLAEHRDRATGEHVLRVARLTHEMARHLAESAERPEELDDDFLRQVGIASILHDVGKISVPDSILHKPGPLTPEERKVMERHAVDGGAMLKRVETLLSGSRQFELAAEIAVHHHERWDGKGYPHGLAGAAIPLSARIVGVADVFDALSSERPYKRAWTQAETLEYMRAGAGTQFDARIVAALHGVLEERDRTRRIVWQPHMTLGHPLIDHDHQTLLELVNQVSSPLTRRDPVALEFVLDELLAYTVYHFAREEKLMEAAGYPDLAQHKRVHAHMIAQVRELQARLAEADEALGDELQAFLERWLVEHILGEDRRYIPFVRADAEL
ncbi:bacteriohemerythrin [Pseudothauera nasutitermitis]|nr:bacteriohemerythrin [Pseudothauera nasutitermitis]